MIKNNTDFAVVIGVSHYKGLANFKVLMTMRKNSING